jgi:hypothetical protein
MYEGYGDDVRVSEIVLLTGYWRCGTKNGPIIQSSLTIAGICVLESIAIHTYSMRILIPAIRAIGITCARLALNKYQH